MQRTIRYLTAAVLFLACITSLWFLLSNLSPIEPAFYLLLIVSLVSVFLGIKLFLPKSYASSVAIIGRLASSRKKTIVICFLIILAGLLLRFFFYFNFDAYRPVSDPETFYSAAKSIADGSGLSGNFLAAFFPYLAAYDNTLGMAMKVINDPWIAVIVLNSLFDILAAIVLFFFIKRLTKPGSIAPLAAFALWILSPFGILFSVQALPIIIVNFFIILVIYLSHIMSEKITKQDTGLMIVLALLLGLAAGCANCFRPIFAVFLIVLPIYLVFLILISPGRVKKLVFLSTVAFAIASGTFLGIQKLNVAFVSYATGFEAPSNSGGLSVYLGSNRESNGRWNEGDGQRTAQLREQLGNDFQAIHSQLTKDGIERYKSYGLSGTLSLFVRKLNEFSTNQNSMYNAADSIVGYSNSKVAKLYNVYILLFIVGLFVVSAYYLYGQADRVVHNRKLTSPIIVLIAITMLGFFLSDVFVEAALRYAQIMYPLFITLTALFIQERSKQFSS